jgi:hypothetical protein
MIDVVPKLRALSEKRSIRDATILKFTRVAQYCCVR